MKVCVHVRVLRARHQSMCLHVLRAPPCVRPLVGGLRMPRVCRCVWVVDVCLVCACALFLLTRLGAFMCVCALLVVLREMSIDG